jgi:hypothetical protein
VPQTQQTDVGPEALFVALNNICWSYVASDLRLLSDSLDGLRTPGAFNIPVIFNAPKLAARLTFDFSVTKTREFRLRPKPRPRTERVAELDVELKLTPAPSIDPGDSQPIRTYGSWPRFIEPPQASGVMSIRTADGLRLHMKVSDLDGFRAATVTEAGARTWEFRELPPRLVASMMLTLAEWVRHGDRPESTPLRSRSGEVLESLLGKLVEGVDGFLLSTADALSSTSAVGASDTSASEIQRRVASYRQHVASILGPEYTAYKIAALAGRIKLLLDENGELSDEPFADNTQRYDLEARLDRSHRPSRLAFALRVPDLLVSGKLYDHFLEVLARPEIVDDLLREMESVLGGDRLPSNAELAAFIQSAQVSQQTAIARIRRTKQGRDEDLILINGMLSNRRCWLLVRITVSFEEREVGSDALRVRQIHAMSLIASKFGRANWRTSDGLRGDDDTRRYFYRAFSSLYRWRQRFQPAGGA